MPWRISIFCAWLFVVSAHVVKAQQTENSSTFDVRHGAASTESEIVRCEQELAGRLVALRKSQESEDHQRQTVESLAKELQAAKPADDSSSVATTEAAFRDARELLMRLSEQTATAQKLHV
jgi:hypothetical protein